MKARMLFMGAVLIAAAVVPTAAQQVTPAVPVVTLPPTPTTLDSTVPPISTPTTPGIPPVQPLTPTAAVPEGTPPDELVPVILDPNDARLASCAAPTSRGFLPYIVRAGDRLDLLLAGVDNFTTAQIAALNCLDDPYVLPPGAVIWLPASVFLQPEATDVPADTPLGITSLTADARDNQSGVTVTWLAVGEAIYLYPCANGAESACVRPRNAVELPPAGTLEIAPFPYAGDYTYRLEVWNGDAAETQDVTFTITCAQSWIGAVESRLCPTDPPIAVTAVYQPFEHGAMIWFSDTLEIYVLTGDGRVRVYEDIFREGMSEPGEGAPEGLFTPIRGFGQIWRRLNEAGIELGWATGQEAAYDSARQYAGRTSYTTYILAPEADVFAVTLIPGMEQGYWSLIAR